MNKIITVDSIRGLETQLAEAYNAERRKQTSGEMFEELRSKHLLAPHLACFYVTYERTKTGVESEPVFAEDKERAWKLASRKFAKVKSIKSLGEIT